MIVSVEADEKHEDEYEKPAEFCIFWHLKQRHRMTRTEVV